MPFDMEMDEYHEDIKMRNDNMKNILITGVSTGIGRAIAEEVLKQSYLPEKNTKIIQKKNSR